MIGKITKGTRTGAIGAYLHGPGRANEHRYYEGKTVQVGGKVLASNLPQVVGDIDSKRWAAELRKPLQLRDREVVKPIWQVSLALPPGERLSRNQWADAAQSFVEKLGLENHPWVAVHHGNSGGGNDHIHIVVNRVDYAGKLWQAKHDYRQVQRACTALEHQFGLSHAPRTRTEQSRERTPKQVIHQGQRAETQRLAAQTAMITRARQMMALYPPVSDIVKPKTLQEKLAAETARLRARTEISKGMPKRNPDRGFGR